MKFRRTCELPHEVSVVGLVLLALAIIAGIILLAQVVATAYGTAIQSFGEENAIQIGAFIVFFIWFVMAWILEGHTPELKVRKDTMAWACVIAAIVAFFGSTILFGTPNPASPYAMPYPSVTAMAGIFAVQLFGLLAGWLGHWCKRCIKIEPDEAPAGGEGT